ncbi:hypothetical protein VP01_1170g1 [Puccinia sorghi]|uniref:Uncharacterized protein n=1 Tax=Puccinia sorghi TaxID=27349 RepID=A0A0L6VSQ6_9BASI|nr:hypothetical protein VP01_1170g1 [Puccinia sorghi]
MTQPSNNLNAGPRRRPKLAILYDCSRFSTVMSRLSNPVAMLASLKSALFYVTQPTPVPFQLLTRWHSKRCHTRRSHCFEKSGHRTRTHLSAALPVLQCTQTTSLPPKPAQIAVFLPTSMTILETNLVERVCGAQLFKPGDKGSPVCRYASQSLNDWLGRLFNREGIEEALDQTALNGMCKILAYG